MADNDKDFDGNDDDNKPELKLVFAEGCFDDFDGTQEELDELIAHITELAKSGELLEKSVALDDLEDMDEETITELLPLLQSGNTRH